MSLMIDIAGTQLTEADQNLLRNPRVTGFILFTRNYESREQLARLVQSIRALRPDLLIAVDYEGGRVQRFRDGFTRIPPMAALGNAEQARACGQVIATELAEFGIDLPFAPVVDLDGGISGVIGDRAFASDVTTVNVRAAAFIEGLADGGMAATLKHFPGHGQVAADSHLELPVDQRTLDEILAADGQPFSLAAPSIMMAHIVFPQVDPLPASLSKRWIHDVLRQQLGFTGAVICDDLNMAGADVGGTYVERATTAAAAGCDLLPVCNNRDAALEILEASNLSMPVGHEQRLQALRLNRSSQLADEQRVAAIDMVRAIQHA